jgi:hypothetical protein
VRSSPLEVYEAFSCSADIVLCRDATHAEQIMASRKHSWRFFPTRARFFQMVEVIERLLDAPTDLSWSTQGRRIYVAMANLDLQVRPTETIRNSLQCQPGTFFSHPSPYLERTWSELLDA